MWGFSAEVLEQLRAQTEATEPQPQREVITIEVAPEHLPPIAQDMGVKHEPTPWPEPFSESQFRSHLDALHARADHVSRLRNPTYRDRVRFWLDRYDAAQSDNERLAKRLVFLQELAATCPVVEVPEPLRFLVLEARRGAWTPEVVALEAVARTS